MQTVDNVFPRKFQVSALSHRGKEKRNGGKNRENRKSLSQNVEINSLDVTRNIVIPIDSRSKSGA